MRKKWAWYAPSILMQAKFKDGKPGKLRVKELVFMIKAFSLEDMQKKAEQIGADLDREAKTFMWEHREANWVFVGIRKILTIANLSSQENRLSDGTEITFSTFIVSNEESLLKLVNGKDVSLKYKED